MRGRLVISTVQSVQKANSVKYVGIALKTTCLVDYTLFLKRIRKAKDTLLILFHNCYDFAFQIYGTYPLFRLLAWVLELLQTILSQLTVRQRYCVTPVLTALFDIDVPTCLYTLITLTGVGIACDQSR